MARPTKKKSAYHHGDLRSSAAIVAQRIVEKQGADALSLREVAAALGVTHRSLYRHFADKDALVSAVAANGFLELSEAMTAQSTEHPLAAYIRFALERRNLYGVMFALPAKRLMGEQELSARVRGAIAVIAEGFRKPGDAPGISLALRDRTMAALGFAHGLCDLWHAGVLRAKDADEAARYILKLAREAEIVSA